MQRFTKSILFCLLALCGYGQQNFNLELVANVPVGEDGTDVWGYVDSTGIEYAIMGTRTTTKIWSLEDPSNPIERASIPGPAGVWRDIKSFEDHLYVTSDQGAEGLLIIDMSGAPETITSLYWKPNITVDGIDTPLNKCHNLYIDTTQGYCYLAGCNVSTGGVLILDLNQDKKEPVHVGTADINYAHDVYVKNDIMYASEIFAGQFNMYDITDKTTPVLLNGENTSFNFTHNAWLSDDEKYLFTTDERANAFVDAWDVSDVENIQFLDRYQPLETQGTGVIPHNTHYIDGFLVTSWYTDGIVINDVTKPDNIIKVGSYDTELVFTSGFEGTWGAYPYLPSGLILGSDINHGLFVLQPVTNEGQVGYQRAAYLEGKVTDVNTGAEIPNVSVEIISDNPNMASTNTSGVYKTGQALAGSYLVRFSHPAYDMFEATATLESGEVTILDVQLGNLAVSGRVIDAEDGSTIANAAVVLVDTETGVSFATVTDDTGLWQQNVRASAQYKILAAKWGYKGTEADADFTSGSPIETALSLGYEDDFFAVLGWENTGDASSGDWEIGDPNTIISQQVITQTEFDVEGDIGTRYMVTGDEGTGGGTDDVDDGFVSITSPPMDMTAHNRIDISYHLWFANGGGSAPPNDSLTVTLSNGTEALLLSNIKEPAQAWSDKIEITVSDDQLDFTDQMTITVMAVDTDPGHIVEGGFDAFSAEGYTITDVTDLAVENIGLSVYPNPVQSIVNVRTQSLLDDDNTLTISDINGKTVMTQQLATTASYYDLSGLASGIYTVTITGKNKTSESVRLVKE